MARKKTVVPKVKEYICHIHDNISYKLEDLRDIDFTEATISEIPVLQEQMRTSIQEILTRLEDAKERGIAMERRLLEYRSAINGLGYDRNND